MSNQQLYLAIGVPIIVSLSGFGLLMTLLLHFVNGIDRRFDRLELTLDAVRQDVVELKERGK